MRKAFFEALNGSLKYDFGPDVFIICAIMHLPGVKGDGLSYEIILTGGELIAFIKEFAPTHTDIIGKIDPNASYSLNAWDW